MATSKTGRIVWHDLFTADRPKSMAFYQAIAGWDYVTEHATDFAWGGGKRDFVLALLNGEAGAGFAEPASEVQNGWIAYIEVGDVDAAAYRAEELGGEVVRTPFEVPGVGRNALLRDPLGALVGIAFSRHGFPVPASQFGVEQYVTGAQTPFPKEFYSGLFGWSASSGDGREGSATITTTSGMAVAAHARVDTGGLDTSSPDGEALWMPALRVASPEASLRKAVSLGGRSVSISIQSPTRDSGIMVADPNGAWFSFQLA